MGDLRFKLDEGFLSTSEDRKRFWKDLLRSHIWQASYTGGGIVSIKERTDDHPFNRTFIEKNLGDNKSELTHTSSRSEDTRFAEECGSGLQLCADEGLIEAKILVKTCDQNGSCRTEPLNRHPYLEFIQLDGPPDERCGPGDCGAVPEALQQGWNPGRWKIVAPPIEGLEQPAPVVIDLDPQEVLKIEFVYTDPG